MKRAVLFLLGLGVFALAFFTGLAAHFPAAAVSRAIESGIASATALSVTLEPVRLTLTGLRSERLVVRGPTEGAASITLTDLRIPYRPILWRGVPVVAAIGPMGRVRTFMAWDGSVIAVEELSGRIEDFPLAAVGGIGVKGRVNLSGEMKPSASPRTSRPELPEGEIRGHVEAMEVTGIRVAGSQLPPVRLDEVAFSIRTGRTVRIERLDARGDLQGTIQGSIIPRLEQLQDTRFNLQVSASMRPSWVQETGALRPLLDGLFPGGRIEGTVGGTVALPAWNPTRGRP